MANKKQQHRNQQQLSLWALRLLLRPLMRFCLRYSLKIQEVTEAAKVALLDVAREDLESRGEEVNVSRLAVISGIHRRDVMRIDSEKNIDDGSKNLVMRVLGQWEADKRFSGAKGPKLLSFSGETSEFAELVRTLTNDVHHTTVLFELERLGLVEETSRGLKLLGSTYVPEGDPEASFTIAGKDVDALICAAEGNIFAPQKIPNLHGRTEYDSIREDAVPEIRRWFYEEGSLFHQKARQFLAGFDLDIHPDPKYRGKRWRAVLGAFSVVREKDSYKSAKKSDKSSREEKG